MIRSQVFYLPGIFVDVAAYLPMMQPAAVSFASGATARNAFGARICYFWFCHSATFVAVRQDKEPSKLDYSCLATYVPKLARGKYESREKGQDRSLIRWAVSASFRSDTDRGKSVRGIINKKLASSIILLTSLSTFRSLYWFMLAVVSSLYETLNH